MEHEVPNIAKRGKLIEKVNPQPEVRKNAEKASDWEYAEEASYLYQKAVLFKDRLIDPLHRLDRERLPDPVIAFENLRNLNTFAAFRLTRSPEGLQNEIIMNSEHFIDKDGKKEWAFGRWAELETLLHEQVHEFQQVYGKDPIIPGKSKNYHNKEFVEKCESIGLHPMLGAGCHTQLADGPFEILMKELGVEKPQGLPEPPGDLNIDWFRWFMEELGKGRKGKSTLHKWTCPECGLNARIGIKGDPEIVHDSCSAKKGEKVFFVRAEEGAHQTIYEAPRDPLEGELKKAESEMTEEEFKDWEEDKRFEADRDYENFDRSHSIYYHDEADTTGDF